MILPIPPQQLKNRLIAEGLISEADFEQVSAEAQRKNQSILDVLASMKGIDPSFLAGLVAEFLGVDRVDFGVHPLQENLVKLLPAEIARQKQAIVFTQEPDGTYGVAMASPSDLETVKFLTQYLKAKVKPYLATENDLNRGYSVYGLQTTSDFKRIIEQNVQETLRGQKKSAEEAAADLPIVAIVDNLVSYAISSRASDIHIEILEDAVLIRYRIDGVLVEMMRIPRAVHMAIVARIKLLGGLKIDEHFKPQDGRFRYQIMSQIVDLRVSVLPTYYGEKIVMRLLESTQKPLSLEELGLLPHNAQLVGENIKKSFGMVLVCGPTGSGKSTTLYGVINILNRPNVNIVTIEDPIEYNMRYVNQSQINPQAGITFAAGLRAILRQDPNIIMVGEIRDAETANIAVQSALTGHLLLSTLHTNDAATAVPRLIDLEVPPFLVASVLNVIIAQRLVRRVCNSCVQSVPVDASIEESIVRQIEDLGITETRAPAVLYRGAGCPVCANTGYRGRIGIFEILPVTDRIKKLIVDPAFSLDAMRQAARDEGTRSMFEDGLEKAQRGLTTIDEVFRVIRE